MFLFDKTLTYTGTEIVYTYMLLNLSEYIYVVGIQRHYFDEISLFDEKRRKYKGVIRNNLISNCTRCETPYSG
jgi:hypothetical protein